MRYLIIGSEGFIGKSLTTLFLKNGHEVSGLDIRSQEGNFNYDFYNSGGDISIVENILKQKEYDVCINAAGNGNIQFAMQHPFRDFEMNCSDCFKLLDIIKNNQPHLHYIHFSSAAVYGNPESLPINENSAVKPISPYGHNKLISEQICYEFSTLYKIKISILRPFSVYGPGLKKQIVWDIYQKSIHSSNGVVELWGTGKESRDFIYITDLANATRLISERSSNELGIFNIANGVEISISDLAATFVNNNSKALSIQFNNQERKGDPINWRADVRLIESLGYKMKVDLTTGIGNYLNWLKELP